MPLSAPPRLIARRSSSTAADPYARTPPSPSLASSVLTIVKVAENDHLYHRKSISAKNNQAPENRVSFAFASFGGRGKGGPARPPLRVTKESTPTETVPGSPPSHGRRASFSGRPNLTPDELYQLAMQSVEPSPAGAPQVLPPNSSPRDRSSSPTKRPPLSRSGSGSSIKSVSTPGEAPVFTPLPDSVFLPFMNRPAEVAQLISTLPTLKLFVLLDKTLPKEPEDSANADIPAAWYPSAPIPKDPRRWTYDHLYRHLTTATREACSDALWVAQARMCIISHSELIWERVKGALGVPVELDRPMTVEQLFIEIEKAEALALVQSAPQPSAGHSIFVPRKRKDSGAISDMNTDEISDDEGMKARGHWNDWDFVLDSPAYGKRSSLGSGARSMLNEDLTTADEEKFPSQLQTKLNILTAQSTASPLSISIPDDIATPMPAASGSHTPDHLRATSHYTASSPLSISAILKSPGPTEFQAPGINAPPVSLPSADTGLGNIAEGEEEEEEVNVHTQDREAPGSCETPLKDPSSDPTNIQGLRLCVTACSIPSYTAVCDDIEDSTPFDPVGQREPGNPLFPGSFARLAVAPTLSANNEALRSPQMPPPSRYKSKSFFDPSHRAGHWGHRMSISKPFSEAGSDSAISLCSFNTNPRPEEFSSKIAV